MASSQFVDKVQSMVFSLLSLGALVLTNINSGHCSFYPAPGVAHLQGQQQAVYDLQEPQNVVGYGYKPAWADIQLQPYVQEIQPTGLNQEHLQNLIKSQQNNVQQEIEQQPYLLPAHTYPLPQQPFEKYQNVPATKYQITQPEYQIQLQKYHVLPQEYQQIQQEKLYQPLKYQWQVEPSIRYPVPSVAHPFLPRDPNQQNVNVLLPLRLFGVQSFPPFFERLIQRVQNYYSVYNPPDLLTVPYSINTPPTISTSSLVPSNEDELPPPQISNEDELTNSVENTDENSEGTTTTQSPVDKDRIDSESTRIGENNTSEDKESTTAESSTEDNTSEDTTKKDDEDTTDSPSSESTTDKPEEEENKTSTDSDNSNTEETTGKDEETTTAKS